MFTPEIRQRILILCWIMSVAVFFFILTYGNLCDNNIVKYLEYKEELRTFYPFYCPEITSFDSQPNLDKNTVNVAIPVIATGGYVVFIPGLIKSARRYLLAEPPLNKLYNVTFMIFTDDKDYISEQLGNDTKNIIFYKKKNRGWPWDTLYKFSNYLDQAALLKVISILLLLLFILNSFIFVKLISLGV